MSDDPVLDRTQALIRLGQGLMYEYCNMNQVSRADAGKVSIYEFFGWLQESTTANYLADKIGPICSERNVPYQTWEDFLRLPDCPAMFQAFSLMWEQVSLGHKPPPKHPISSVHFVALVRWEDGRVSPLSNLMPRELINEAGEYGDGDLCTVLRMAGPRLVELIQQGADHLHDNLSLQISDRVVQLMVQALSSSISMMQPDAAEQMKSLVSLVHAYVNPPVPESVAALVARKRQERQGTQGPSLQGGWNA